MTVVKPDTTCEAVHSNMREVVALANDRIAEGVRDEARVYFCPVDPTKPLEMSRKMHGLLGARFFWSAALLHTRRSKGQ